MPTSIKRIGITLADEEYAAWEAKAAAYGTTMTGLIRYAIEALPAAKKSK